MRITFVVRSVRYPSGGIVTNFELANALARRGHDVCLAHVPNAVMGGMARSADDLRWFDFEPSLRHQFARNVLEIGATDFVVGFPPSMGGPPGLPLLLVQGHALGAERQRRRMHAPCPKICVARWLVDFGRDAGVPEAQLVYVPNGISHEKYRLTRPIDDRPAVVSMMYHDHPTKGTRYGLDALRLVTQRHPAVRSVVFGTRAPDASVGPTVAYLRDPSQRVIIDDVYNSSRIFVQPSLQEGFGLTAVEAMACGCALVTTSNGGSDEYAIHRETALVAPPADSRALAECIDELLSDDGTRVRLATRGRDYVKRFDWDRSAELFERFLREYGAEPDRYRAPS